MWQKRNEKQIFDVRKIFIFRHLHFGIVIAYDIVEVNMPGHKVVNPITVLSAADAFSVTTARALAE